jgi:hypothetical protein
MSIPPGVFSDHLEFVFVAEDELDFFSIRPPLECDCPLKQIGLLLTSGDARN